MKPLTFNRAKRVSLEERFWSKVNCGGSPDACWNWTHAISPKGYGKFGFNGQNTHSNRVCWIIINGNIPSDRPYVLHKCDNRACVNPNHLLVGNQFDNMRDCVSKGRHHNLSKKSCKRGHSLVGENAYVNPTTGKRYCKTCIRRSQKDFRLKKKGIVCNTPHS